jgi:hypothetical protein
VGQSNVFDWTAIRCLTHGTLPQHLRLAATPVHSYISIYMSSSDLRIPVKRLRPNRESGQMEEVQQSVLFLKGPIPLWWLTRVAALPGKALALGVALWWLYGMSRGAIKLTSKALGAMSVSRDAASDGLRRLEVDGLVSIQREKGRRSVIHIFVKLVV